MFGADVSIVWVDENDGPQAVDYYLSAYTQVSNIRINSRMLSIVGKRKRKGRCVVRGHPWARAGPLRSSLSNFICREGRSVQYKTMPAEQLSVVMCIYIVVQCRAGQGACPDTEDTTVGSCSNDVTLVEGFRENGQQCVVFSRNYAAGQIPPPNCYLFSLSLFTLSFTKNSSSFCLHVRQVYILWHLL